MALGSSAGRARRCLARRAEHQLSGADSATPPETEARAAEEDGDGDGDGSPPGFRSKEAACVQQNRSPQRRIPSGRGSYVNFHRDHECFRAHEDATISEGSTQRCHSISLSTDQTACQQKQLVPESTINIWSLGEELTVNCLQQLGDSTGFRKASSHGWGLEVNRIVRCRCWHGGHHGGMGHERGWCMACIVWVMRRAGRYLL